MHRHSVPISRHIFVGRGRFFVEVTAESSVKADSPSVSSGSVVAGRAPVGGTTASDAGVRASAREETGQAAANAARGENDEAFAGCESSKGRRPLPCQQRSLPLNAWI